MHSVIIDTGLVFVQDCAIYSGDLSGVTAGAGAGQKLKPIIVYPGTELCTVRVSRHI